MQQQRLPHDSSSHRWKCSDAHCRGLLRRLSRWRLLLRPQCTAHRKITFLARAIVACHFVRLHRLVSIVRFDLRRRRVPVHSGLAAHSRQVCGDYLRVDWFRQSISKIRFRRHFRDPNLSSRHLLLHPQLIHFNVTYFTIPILFAMPTAALASVRTSMGFSSTTPMSSAKAVIPMPTLLPFTIA